MPNRRTSRKATLHRNRPAEVALEVQSRVRHRQRAVRVHRAEQPCGRLFPVSQRLSGQGQQPGQGRHGGGDGNVHGDLNAFSEVQALQQTLYSDFARRRRDIDASDQALATKNARADFRALRKGADRTARKHRRADAKGGSLYRLGERHLSRSGRQAQCRTSDPLSRQVLRDYAFDCSDKSNFPAFGNVHVGRRHAAKQVATTNIAQSPKTRR